MYGNFPAELTTERLHLRRWLASDAEPYRGLWSERDPRAPRRLDAEGRPTVEEFRRRLIENPFGSEPGLGLLPIELGDRRVRRLLRFDRRLRHLRGA